MWLNRTLLAGAVALLLAPALTPAHAAVTPADALTRARAQMLAQRLMPHAGQPMPNAAARPAPRRRHVADVPVDETLPTLLAFGLDGTRMNGTKLNPQIPMHLKMADAGVGVSYAQVVFEGPSGQLGYGGYWTGGGIPSAEGSFAWNGDALMEPGIWRLKQMEVYDSNMNGAVYDTAALAAMGSATEVQVTNRKFDKEAPLPPSVFSLMTPTVNASDPRPLRVNVEVTDAGTPQAAGIQYVQVGYCRDSDGVMLWLWGDSPLPLGQKAYRGAVATTYNWNLGWNAHGTYKMCYVGAGDNAGNYWTQLGPQYGGDFDFEAAYPGQTTITVTP